MAKAKTPKNALPLYVSRTATRHGTPILQFNRPGFPKHTFQAKPGSAEFLIEYMAQFRGLTVRTVPEGETLEAFEHFADWTVRHHPEAMIKLPFGHLVLAEATVIMGRAVWQQIQVELPKARVEHVDKPLPSSGARRQP
jgi:hypothetical protein